jgi:hypothetical protein
MTLTFNLPIQNVLHANLRINSKHAPKMYQIWMVLYAKNQLVARVHVELEDNSTLWCERAYERAG